MTILCTICARANSKGLKNKNFLKIKGKSLLRHTLDLAIKTKIFNQIAVTVDKNKIDLGKNKKKIIFIKRPKNLASDDAKKLDVIRHAVKTCEKKNKIKYKYIFDLDVTSPLRKLRDIHESFKKFKREKSLNLISVTKSKKNPYFNLIEIKNKRVKLVKNSNKIFNRQKAPKTYDMNASIYIWKKEYLFRSYNLFNKKTSVYVMPPERSIDIDNNLDFKLVKFLLK